MPYPFFRIPLHPGDADLFEKNLAAAEDDTALIKASELERLSALADWKRHFDRAQSPGPVDAQESYRLAAKTVGPSPSWMRGLSGAREWVNSTPRSRHPLLHGLLIPENAIFGAMEALSGDKPLTERASRLALAIPGAIYPPAGYPIEPARDRMYEDLGPIAGTAVDFMLPGPGEASAGLHAAGRFLRPPRIPTALVDEAGDVIRRLRPATPVR